MGYFEIGDVEEATKPEPLKQIRWIQKGLLLQVNSKVISFAQVKYVALDENNNYDGQNPELDHSVVFYFSLPYFEECNQDEFGDTAEGTECEFIAYKGKTAEAIRKLLLSN